MSDPIDPYEPCRVVNGVQDPIIALPHTIPRSTDESLGPRRSGILLKVIQGTCEAAADLGWKRPELTPSPRLKLDDG
jgi:hypothetical protein